MGHLEGFAEYLKERYEFSVLDRAVQDGEEWMIYLHGDEIVRARIVESRPFEIDFTTSDGQRRSIEKHNIKLLFKAELADEIQPLIKTNEQVKAKKTEPIIKPRQRYHIKNKTLYVAMKDREVLFFTMLGGEVLRGLVESFSRYEIYLKLKGGQPVTILRHALFNVRNKKGRSYLKSAQQKYKDWEKSPLYVKEEGE